MEMTLEADHEPTLDGALWERYRDGDVSAFSALYDRYAGLLQFFLQSLTRDPARAEDLTHKTVLRLLGSERDLPGATLRPYLFTIARNLALDGIRRDSVDEKVRPRLVPVRDEEGPDAAARQAESARAISDALDRLPPEQREAVILRVYGDFAWSEMAEIVGTSMATVASRYRYAVQKLAELIPDPEEPR